MTDKLENTPGRKAIAVMEENKVDVFKKPTGLPKRRSKHKVLDEEAYIEGIEKIIQRDFFPDLEKIKAQNDYLDALERNDITKLRELYAKYSGKKPPIERIPSPATFETPARTCQQTPETSVPVENTEQSSQTNRSEEDGEETKAKQEEQRKVSLDQYLQKHTSQDNESFKELIAKASLRHRQKFWYLYREVSDEEKLRLKKERTEVPAIEAQVVAALRPLTVDTWNYTDRNHVMFVPDGVSPEIPAAARQEVVHANTRLSKNPFNEVQSQEAIGELAKTQAKILDGKIGVDGKEIIKDATPRVGGFSLVRTPSPSPSAMESPLMTWGEIEGTPFRLDGSDTPLPPRSQGPSFKIAEPPRREQIALALAEKVGEKNRDEKRRAIATARKQFSTPSPRPHTSSAADRLASMSPAARRFATAKLGLGGVVQHSQQQQLLGVSPLPSPRRPSTGQRRTQQTTPGRNSRAKLLGTPGQTTSSGSDHLTDDLLKISLPKRCKASDFF